MQKQTKNSKHTIFWGHVANGSMYLKSLQGQPLHRVYSRKQIQSKVIDKDYIILRRVFLNKVEKCIILFFF